MPPDICAVAVPSLPLLQLIFVPLTLSDCTIDGSVKVMLALVAKQPFVSFIVTV